MINENDLKISNTLKAIEKEEKKLHKIIDDELELEEEIREVAEKASQDLNYKPMAGIEIQGREFILVASFYNDGYGKRHILVVARERTKLVAPRTTILKADAELDENYTKKENLLCCIKGLLGHITGYIKPETLD